MTDGGTDPTLVSELVLMPTVAAAEGLAAATLPAPGYKLGEVIGRGGMGEIVLADDRRMGRAVAIKRMRGISGTDAIARFFREARIQARLDHPAIVPVHELGLDEHGQPYFTMKRLTGRTLQQVMVDAPLRRLLRAFVDVCRAIDFAHARGIVHRDLKPTNIMLGDYGEVYVIDWGIARVLADSDADTPIATIDPDNPGDSGSTVAGAVLGTPGYMAPEQARGEPVTAPADVYALGAILFELLARESLHPRSGALAATLVPHAGSPANRRPDLNIPPELAAVCVDALAASPTARPDAHALAERVQRYLDGDRDLEQRRALASSEVHKAREAVASGDRAIAIQAAGRALALDRESREAAGLVTQLMLEPPDEMPKAVLDEVDKIDQAYAREQWRAVGWSYAVWCLFMPVVWWQGITNYPLVVGGMGMAVVLAILARLNMKRPRLVLTFALNIVTLLLFARVTSTVMLFPGVVAVSAAAWITYPTFIGRPAIAYTIMLFTIAAPFVLEELGVISTTWTVEQGSVSVRSAALAIGGLPTKVIVISGAVSCVLVGAYLSHAIAASRRDLARKLELQAWHLRKLLPPA